LAQDYVSLSPLINWRVAARPLDWSKHFGRTAPLEAELGCGNGERLVRRAQKNPELNLVGIDPNWGAIRRALRKIAVAQINNVRLLMGRAGPAFQFLIKPQELSRAEALFPVPWPKERHEPKRLLTHQFLLLANSRLMDGGSLHMVTDHKEHWLWAMDQARDTGFAVEVISGQSGMGTKYERKWQDQGQQVFYELLLKKGRHIGHPVWEEPEVHSYFMKEIDLAAFPLTAFKGEPFIAFVDMVFDPLKQRAMLRTVVEEDGFNQPLWLEFIKRETGWELRAAPGCPLVPTKGVLSALKQAAELASGGKYKLGKGTEGPDDALESALAGL
jgi:tRNA (guanine-N7-)-methyltransferase